MVSNAVAEEDAAGNIKPSKARSTERIDGVAAWCDALVVAAGDISAPEEVSAYETVRSILA
jgi:phage terminase large subunit-like protein